MRFSDFSDGRGWQTLPLSKVLRPVSREVAKPSTQYTGLGLRSHGKGTFQKLDQDPKKIAMDHLYVVHAGDLIVNITFAWEGAIAVADHDDEGCLVSHRFPTYEFKPNVSTPDFFRHVIARKAFVYKLGVISPGGAGRNRVMNKKDFLRLSVSLPSLSEQKKISAILSSLDELIDAEAEMIQSLEDQKIGLMQNLFPTSGKAVPAQRFEEFRKNGDWAETTIGKLGKFHYGKSAPKWSLADDAPTKCVRYGELYSRFGTVISQTYSRTTIEPKKLRFSKGGEILVPRVGEKPEDFGKCCCYLPLADIAIGEMISVFQTSQDSLFYTYYFKHLYQDFAKVVEGQNVKNLYYANLEPLKIYRPALAEQEKIAGVLSSIDAILDAHIERRATLDAQKAGLLQRLLPDPSEVQP